MSRRIQAFDRARLQIRLIALVSGIVLATLVAVGLSTLSAFDRAISPELEKRSRLIGTQVRTELQRILELGVPFESMSGLDRYLLKALQDFDEVDRIAVMTADGTIVAEASRPTAPGPAAGHGREAHLPVLDGSRVVGQILVRLDPRVIQDRLQDVFLDVLVLGIAAVLVAVELVLALVARSVAQPLARIDELLDQQAGGDFRRRIPRSGIGGLGRVARRLNDHASDLAERFGALTERSRAALASEGGLRIAARIPLPMRPSAVGDIRVALFLYSAATEVGTAFMPVFARAVTRPDWLAAEWAAALPLLAYLTALALLAPIGGGLARRHGPRRLFLAAIVPTMVSLGGLAAADSLAAVTAWRSLLAVAYALATVSCHEYALRAGTGSQGTRGVSAFLSVIFAGVFCGSTLGGVLAGRFGYGAAFLAGAMVCCVAGLLAARSMAGEAGDPEPALPQTAVATAAGRRPAGGFLALLFCLVVPLQATTAIVVWYLVPLMLANAGAGPAEITRVVMLYYLAAILVGPVSSRLAERGTALPVLVVIGAVGAAAALGAASQSLSAPALALAITALGAAHALQRAPQHAIASEWTRRQAGSLGALRLMERLGAIIGLACSAMLLQGQPATSSLAQLGLVVVTAALAFIPIDLAARRRITETPA
ncbi:MAG: hypothetical protein KDG55_13035 [Rhodocyclaceae bacterium]|nr:hypothetical protein [Rhodocyclaceae bacterium]